MIIDRYLQDYCPDPSNISLFREMLLEEYFPRFQNLSPEKLVSLGGLFFHEMCYLHKNILKIQIHTNHEIWMMAKWICTNRYLYYDFVSSMCANSKDSEPLAHYLGTSIYEWFTNETEMDETTKETLRKIFEEVPWEFG